MQPLKYVGPHDSTDLHAAAGRVIRVARGSLALIPDELVDGLIASKAWKKPSAAERKAFEKATTDPSA
jgi:hypothetical protein